MITTCPKCHQEYDDVYHSTQCPHEYFQMHCHVFADGNHGCAHAVEELTKFTTEKVVPNPNCEQLLMILEIQKDLTDESCHFGDCS